MSLGSSSSFAQTGGGIPCGDFCNGYYGRNWTVTRTPVYSQIGGKNQETGLVISIQSDAGLTITYNYEDAPGTCSAAITLGFTRYGPPDYYKGMITGICVLSGPNGLVEATMPATGKVLVPPTGFTSPGITNVESQIQALANSKGPRPPQSVINAILAFSNETSGCTAAR